MGDCVDDFLISVFSFWNPVAWISDLLDYPNFIVVLSVLLYILRNLFNLIF